MNDNFLLINDDLDLYQIAEESKFNQSLYNNTANIRLEKVLLPSSKVE